MNQDLQKASMLKRVSAYSFDLILLVCLVIALAAGLSGVLNYGEYNARMDQAYERYGQMYGVDVSISWDAYDQLTDADKARYEAALEAINKDEEVLRDYSMMVNLTLIIATVSVLLGHVVLELIVPLLFGNGQTLGKKIFGIALMRTDGVKITPFMMFVRTILGKFTLETMIPVLIVIMLLFQMVGMGGTLLLVALLVAQIACMVITRNNSAIHDLLACTVAVDMASQHIFDSPEALLEYKKQQHAERVSRADY